ncbi:MAG: CCA tRNA nucleotidyltransferase [Archaeoglobus sp.]|nr:CCA tRNA nucleotidyltransferase [Archaeoglobus sp.]
MGRGKRRASFSNPNFDSEFDRIVRDVIKEIVPTEQEVSMGQKAKDELERRVKEILRDYPELEYRFLGSFPRNTWIKGNLEIDLFILFPEKKEERDLERIGLEIGRRILDETEERYAAHPYIHGKIMDVEVDVVPCYALKSAEKIKSAVDRTPFHHDWVKDRIKGKEDDIRLLKAFLKASDIYGAEYKIRGFSGYLCELLILHYGSFRDLIKKACSWKRGLVIDVAKGEEHYGGDAPLFIVDPVDSKRNVAANLSLDSMAKFVEKCRDFYLEPSKGFFKKKEPVKVSGENLKEELKKRGSKILAVIFDRPDIVEDNLYTQLERAKTKLFEFLEENDFMPLNAAYFVSQKKCVLVFETQVKEISKVKKVLGPPFEEWEHVKRFREKKRLYKPFIEGGRYYAFDVRKITKPGEAIQEYIRTNPKALGKNISEIIASYTLLEDEEILSLDFDGFFAFLAEFFKLREVEG